jgi:hypothetical protein
VTKSAEGIESARSIGLGTTPPPRELLRRIESEYREMPGLSLTPSQAERLWGLDSSTCEVVLTTLIERRVLRRTTNGVYLRGPHLGIVAASEEPSTSDTRERRT